MSKVSEIATAISSVLAGRRVPEILDMRAATAGTRATMCKAGFIGMLPLWEHMGATVGLIARPSSRPEDWQAIFAMKGQALTLAASARLAIPRFMVAQFFADNAKLLDALAGDWLIVRPILAEIHTALGGDKRTIEPLDKAIGDTSERRSLGYDAEQPAAFQHAISSLYRSIDTTSEFSAFANWLESAVEGDPAVGDDTAIMGCWERMCIMWSQQLLARAGRKVSPPLRVAISLLESFSGVDAAVPGSASWTLRSVTGYGESNLLSLARKVELDAGSDDISRGLVQAVCAEGLKYRGTAHAEATALLDERDEPERAWGALNSAAWWMGRHGYVAPAIFDGAEMICDRRGWEEVKSVVHSLREALQ